ncbi:dihydrofolate reductase family protein [Micromonospora violae]|uniref:dihydrofolate reductase family protein n=1 Tax=Micromonospora violae TaxID=1278207 RepID=UPI00102D0C86|nr:dihydrofolate reductase family protein [Micromonospora violae]
MTHETSRHAQVDTTPSVVLRSDHFMRSALIVRKLKQEDGQDIWLCGGGHLARQLLPEIDELVVKRYPLVVGAGISMFDGPFNPARFTVASTRTFESGVAISTYIRT